MQACQLARFAVEGPSVQGLGHSVEVARRAQPAEAVAHTLNFHLESLLFGQVIEGPHDALPWRASGLDRVLQVDEFLSAAERVASGGSALDPQVVASLVSARGDDDPLAQLTEREHEVLELMAQGLTNAGIAKRLYLSERTVEAHVRHVLMKLNLPESEDAHRRVLAVLARLNAPQQQ